MSGTMIDQFSAIAVRVEGTPGVDSMGGTPASSDQVFGSFVFRPQVQTVDDPSLTGALDASAPMVTGTRPVIELTVPMRGSGTPGTAPPWAPLLRACGMSETVQAAAIAATAATAGTTTTATLGAPYVTTAQFYRGLPAILTGNPVGPVISPIVDYTAARVATFGETFGTALSTATQVAIPINVAYRPLSDNAAFPTVTIYLYRGGYRWQLTGGTGSARLSMSTGGVPMLMITMQATLSAQGAVAIPAALQGSASLQPPVFLNGRSQLMQRIAKVSSMDIDMGNNLLLPPNPEAIEGVDPALITGRSTVTTLDPTIDTTTQAALWTAFRAGTTGPLVAVVGSTAGNRFAITQPSLRRVQMDPGSREGLGVNSIRAQNTMADAGLIITSF